MGKLTIKLKVFIFSGVLRILNMRIKILLFVCFREFVHTSLFATYYFGNTVYVVFIASSFKQVTVTYRTNNFVI